MQEALGSPVVIWAISVVGIIAALRVLLKVIGIVIIGADEVGIVQKRWSRNGSVGEGQVIALNGEAGFQPKVLRTGLHLLTPLFYCVHKQPLITIGRGKIGYIFSRDGIPLEPSQTLGKVIPGGFEDCEAYLRNGGQRGPNRGMLREGTYAINTAAFAVLTDSGAYYVSMGSDGVIETMQKDLTNRNAFTPVIIPGDADQYGIVTVHDGQPLTDGDIIAPIIDADHQGYQNPEAFLSGGGRRGRQLQVLVEGTYFLNRMFATVELKNKTTVEVGNVGVIVSYVGTTGEDLSGQDFSHGELVSKGNRGVVEKPLGPGKYALNEYAYKISIVPTTNVVLKWKESERGEHGFDAQLCEIELITKDGYDVRLPLSVVCHIDYNKAPSVIQRFGDVKKLVDQTLDPFVSAYFKNVGQSMEAIELLHQRTEVQAKATTEMKDRFAQYDLVLVDVLISTPHGAEEDSDNQFESLLNQLRLRKLAEEQRATFAQQQAAAEQQKALNEAIAITAKQAELTQSNIEIEIQRNQGAADLAMKEMAAKAKVATADGDRQSVIMAAEGKSQAIVLEGNANATAIAKVGVAEGIAIEQKVAGYGGPQFEVYSNAIKQIATAIEVAKPALVPQTNISMGGSDGSGVNAGSTISGLINIMSIEKLTEIAKSVSVSSDNPELKEYIDKLKAEIMNAAQAKDVLVTNPLIETPVVEAPVVEAAANEDAQVVKTQPQRKPGWQMKQNKNDK